MSQMSDLATILDEMTQTGKALIRCGESLIKAATSMQRWPEATPASEDKGVPCPGIPTTSLSTGDTAIPESRSAQSPAESPKATRIPKSKPKAAANTGVEGTEPQDPVIEPAKTDRKEPSPPVRLTKEEARAMLANLAQSGHREEAKALVVKYANGGSFSDIDPERYPELAEEVKKIHG